MVEHLHLQKKKRYKRTWALISSWLAKTIEMGRKESIHLIIMSRDKLQEKTRGIYMYNTCLYTIDPPHSSVTQFLVWLNIFSIKPKNPIEDFT